MLEIHDLSLRLGGKQILEGIGFRLRSGGLTALVGRNGSGKSTLLSCVNAQLPYTGTVTACAADLSRLSSRQRAKTVAILPQHLNAPHITAREMAEFGRNPYLDLTGRLMKADRDAVADALEAAEVSDLAERYVDTLSGGELQRVALAMILAQDTPIVLLDEPTAHMDQCYEGAFLQKLQQLSILRNKAVLVVLHDLSLAVQYARDILVLDGGRMVFAGSVEECLRGRTLEETFSLTRYTVSGENGTRIFFG